MEPKPGQEPSEEAILNVDALRATLLSGMLTNW
jgi:hypothetical protein